MRDQLERDGGSVGERQDRAVTPVARITQLTPADYRRTPWKNGGGVAIDLAGESHAGATGVDWNDALWRFGRTTISTGAPFSDLAGFDRVQMVVAGRGLVLQTPGGDIDVREPFKVVRFSGETPVVSRLEAGAVDVVNLIADRRHRAIELRVLEPGAPAATDPGTHVFYAACEACVLRLDGVIRALEVDHALLLDADSAGRVEGLSGVTIFASVYSRR